MLEQKAAAAALASSATYWGLTIAQINEYLQAGVAVLTGISLIVLIAVNLKKLRGK